MLVLGAARLLEVGLLGDRTGLFWSRRTWESVWGDRSFSVGTGYTLYRSDRRSPFRDLRTHKYIFFFQVENIIDLKWYSL